MSHTKPTLHMICGKVASGKSTLSAKLGARDATIVIAEDAWLHALYGEEMSSISDYVRCSAKLRDIVGPHVASLLNAGVSVVLDFQANTIDSRSWMRSVLDQTNADHKLHFLNIPDEVCIARMHARNASGDHLFAPTEEQFFVLSQHFVAPAPDEGFNVVLHETGGS